MSSTMCMTDGCPTHLGRLTTARSYEGRVVTTWVTSILHEKWFINQPFWLDAIYNPVTGQD